MITALCVLNSRDTDAKRPYDGEWVRKLKAMVERHLPLEHEFRVLSDVDVAGVKRIPLEHGFPGWWAKMELFRPDLPISENQRILYLDLDCVVLDNLTQLVAAQYGAWMTPNTRTGYPTMWADGKRGVRRYRSACMVWNHGNMVDAWRLFEADSRRWILQYHGDQDFLGHRFPGLKTFPEDWFKNLRLCKPEYPPPGVKVVFCNPWKNHQAGHFPWVQKAWEAHWNGPSRVGIYPEQLAGPP